jgi:hypothetical protein
MINSHVLRTEIDARYGIRLSYERGQKLGPELGQPK